MAFSPVIIRMGSPGSTPGARKMNSKMVTPKNTGTICTMRLTMYLSI